MAYRLTKGAYYSHVTRRTYEFRPGDPIDQRRAKQQMEHENEVFQNAEATRRANAPPDTRTPADIVRAETVHKSQTSGEPGGVMQARLAQLRQQLANASTPNDKARVQRRIDALQLRSDEHTAVVEAKAAREALASSPEVVAAIAEAQQQLDDWRFRGDVAADVVDGAAAALDALKTSLDVTAYKATAIELRAKHNQNRNAEIVRLKAQIAETEGQLFTTLADEAPPEAAAPQAPEAATV